ncbi:MAG TPA: DUF6165 family protein [Rhizomicrobium sp.]|jgi:hypothetical protein|nr:DUF6165 family protein [Rhizomicrobium sp.]
MRAIHAAISYGEAADKITILSIKSERLRDPAQLANVRRELDLLKESFRASVPGGGQCDALIARLKAVNETLWQIEDDIRLHEARGDFGESFVRLARAVYRNNDERARLKRQIDAQLGSDLREEKSYAAGDLSHG